MSQRVDLVSFYFHPRTGKRITKEAAQRYNRRAKKKIKAQPWLVVRHAVGETKGLSREQIASLKKRAGRIAYAARLTTVEKILPLRKVSDRHVRLTLGRHRVFQKLYDDFIVPGDIQRRGGIRITVGGTVEGRRIKEVIHLAFHRGIWQSRFSSEEQAKEEFKSWIVGSILTNLRRRGLRLSDPRESYERIHHRQTGLIAKRDLALQRLEFETSPEKRGGILEQIEWATKAIGDQKKSKQLRGATIRLEKII